MPANKETADGYVLLYQGWAGTVMAEGGVAPRYVQIAEHLEERIRSGQLRPHQRVPSESELAQQFGVSRITSRQALRALAERGLIYRVPGLGSFVAEPRPAALPEGHVAGLVMPRLDTSLATGIMLGIEQVLREAGIHLLFRCADRQPEEEAKAVRELRAAGVTGLLVWPCEGEYYNPELLRLRVDQFPVVLVDRHLRGIDTDRVHSDNVGGGYQATRHLLQLGHRRIAFVSSPMLYTSTIEDRFHGYELALAEAGLPLDRNLVWEGVRGGAHTPGVGPTPTVVAAIADFLRQHPDVTGVFAHNDLVARCVLEAAAQLGRRVPEDLAVVGFDDLDLAAAAPVPLTTIRQPSREMGATAARLLLQRLDDPAGPIRAISLPTCLVVRASTVGAEAQEGAAEAVPAAEAGGAR